MNDYIQGIRGLAAFLHISFPTAQRLKNEGRIPFYQVGRKLFFEPKEVINALKIERRL